MPVKQALTGKGVPVKIWTVSGMSKMPKARPMA